VASVADALLAGAARMGQEHVTIRATNASANHGLDLGARNWVFGVMCVRLYLYMI
jgi:hypothetical protein